MAYILPNPGLVTLFPLTRRAPVDRNIQCETSMWPSTVRTANALVWSRHEIRNLETWKCVGKIKRAGDEKREGRKLWSIRLNRLQTRLHPQ